MRRLTRIAAALVCLALGACQHAPRHRVGGLPFPGPATLFKVVDPENLGRHHYGVGPAHDPPEVSRGIVYTCEAGFVDVAHVRMATDWTRHVHDRVRPLLERRAPTLNLDGPDRTHYAITLDHEDAWMELPKAERHLLLDRLALRIGQRLALLITTWHELLTFEGFKTTRVVPERRSAFNYDDMVSHVVGLRVAGRALQDATRTYDGAVTQALDLELRELGAVSPECTQAAAKAVKGTWWKPSVPIVRHFASGWVSEEVEPLLVPDFACCEAPSGEPVALPPLHLDGELNVDAVMAVRVGSAGVATDRLDGRLDPPASGPGFTEDEIYRLVDLLAETHEASSDRSIP